MMLSDSILYKLRNNFFNSTSFPSNININNFSGKFLVGKEMLGGFFIPIINSASSIFMLRSLNTVTTIAIPLVCENGPIPRRTFHSIITDAISTYSNNNMTVVRTSSGYTYNVGLGTILKEDFTPLLIGGFLVPNTPLRDTIDYNMVCLVSPRVFSETDFMSKYISKNLISSLSSMIVYNRGDQYDISVIVTKEIDNLIVSPRIPNCDISNTFNNLLKVSNL